VGILDTVRRWFGTGATALTPYYGTTVVGGMAYPHFNLPPIERITFNGAATSWSDAVGGSSVLDMSPAEMWRTQPHLRTVVSFLARNIAQLGLHSYVRDGDDRKRDRESDLARLLRQPSMTSTLYELIYALVVDDALYDSAYWAVIPDPDARSGWSLVRLPPAWVVPVADSAFTWGEYRVTSLNGKTEDLPASSVWSLHGYHPTDPRRGSSALLSLKGTMEEALTAQTHRNRVWERGGKVSSVLMRPKDAPKWSDAARERFRADWYAKYTGDGPYVGGTPILEDGMTLERADFSASDQQFVEGLKLSFATVAAAFHVNPTMVGILDNANYANVREFRKALYGDTLGPIMAKIEDRLNTFLLPMIGVDNDQYYVEFNISEKLQGNFEEQTLALQASVGRPWMTANEARARMNMPALDGDANELITPLNVIAGGQASPRDSAPNKP